MKFALKLIVGGSLAAVFGLVWLVIAIVRDDLGEVIAGGLWKGPLLSTAGVGAAFMGVKFARERMRDRNQKTTKATFGVHETVPESSSLKNRRRTP